MPIFAIPVVESTLKAIDHVANHSSGDRYVFLCFLVVSGVAVFLSIKWLVGRLERQTGLLEGLFKEANQAREHAATALVLNTDAIKDNTNIMHRTCSLLERMERDRERDSDR